MGFVNFTSEKKVFKALQFDLSSEDFFKQKDNSFVPRYKKQGKETEVTLYGYAKEAMEGHIKEMKTLGIEVDLVSVICRGLQRFVQFFTKEVGPFYFLFP